jgi:NAD(P)-dependent dehydrogenase (short-subunit alcohol dehydrogenase family)
MRDFKGRVAVITGGANGIGRELGALLASRGAKVVLSDINPDRLASTVRELRSEGGDVTGVAANVAEPESVEALADAVFEQHGRVHLLFNNAGVSLGDSRVRAWALPLQDWNWGMSVNFMGVVHGVRAFVPRMVAGGEDGVVVNTTSPSGGLGPERSNPIYSASKAALTNYTEVLYHQLKAEGSKIRVGLLYPGPGLVRTDLMKPPRPEAFIDPANPPPPGKDMAVLAKMMGDIPMSGPDEVAAWTIEAIEREQFWIIHPDTDMTAFNARNESLLARRNPE